MLWLELLGFEGWLEAVDGGIQLLAVGHSEYLGHLVINLLEELGVINLVGQEEGLGIKLLLFLGLSSGHLLSLSFVNLAHRSWLYMLIRLIMLR